MAHLANNTYKSIHKVGIPDVFMGFVEDHEFVESLALKSGVTKKLQQNHEKPQGFVLLDEFISQVNDHQSPWPHLPYPVSIISPNLWQPWYSITVRLRTTSRSLLR